MTASLDILTDIDTTWYTSTVIDMKGARAVSDTELREKVRRRYAVAATSGSCCGPEGSCSDPGLDVDVVANSYTQAELESIPEGASAASLGCGNPTVVADLRPGETVLDLGSGGGIDVLISARRVGENGFAYGLDMTDEMLDLARANAAEAQVSNVEFLKGYIEDIPLEDASVDVVISNCVINLSTDKPAVFAEIARVLRPGGRIGISDIVADDALTLRAHDLPASPNIGYFLMGTGTNTFMPAGSSGFLCIAPGLQRYLPPVNDTSQFPGGFDRVVGTQGNGHPVSAAITPGSTWNFQAWHRDSMAATSNFTDAVSVTFQ